MLALTLALAIVVVTDLPRTGHAAEAQPTSAQVRRSVETSLPYLKEAGAAWMVERKCNSCHTVTFQVWAYEAALARGLAVDRRELDAWASWALADSLSDRHWFKLRPRSIAGLESDGVPEAVLTKLGPIAGKVFLKEPEFLAELGKMLAPEERERHKACLVQRAALPNDGGGPDTLAQLLLSRAARRVNPEAEKSFEAIRSLLLEWQEPEGHWVAAGQMPNMRRPKTENDEVTTMWAVLALAETGRPDDPAAEPIRRALARLEGVKPGVSTESLLLRLLIERRFGDPHRADGLLAMLLREQQMNGGWGWLRASKTDDAFATGQVLYALGAAGRGVDDRAVRRAWDRLLATQGEDGSWAVPTSAISVSTHPPRVERTDAVYTYWGTAWAVLGMLRTLPDNGSPPRATSSLKPRGWLRARDWHLATGQGAVHGQQTGRGCGPVSDNRFVLAPHGDGLR